MTIRDIFNEMSYGPAPESGAEAQDWLKAHGSRFGHWIDGGFTKPGETFETKNPATAKVLAEVTQGSAKDLDAAIAAARRAQPKWARLSGHQRARHLYALARLVQKNARLLAVLETMDNGKPIRESRDIDIPLVIRHFYHHAGWAQIADKATVLGVSIDSIKSHEKFIQKHALPFAILSDEDHEIANAYGVWVEKSMYGKTYMGTERTTFIIAPDGKVRAVFPKVKPDEHLNQVLAVI
jgi:hypothetical protein